MSKPQRVAVEKLVTSYVWRDDTLRFRVIDDASAEITRFARRHGLTIGRIARDEKMVREPRDDEAGPWVPVNTLDEATAVHLRLWATAPAPTPRWRRAMSDLPERIDRCALNTDPPPVRCGMCGGRCKWEPPRSITCYRCSWSSHSPRRTGLWWRLRVLVGR